MICSDISIQNSVMLQTSSRRFLSMRWHLPTLVWCLARQQGLVWSTLVCPLAWFHQSYEPHEYFPRWIPKTLDLNAPNRLKQACMADPWLLERLHHICAERCRSGRTGRSRKPLSLQGFPGFESLSLRQNYLLPIFSLFIKLLLGLTFGLTHTIYPHVVPTRYCIMWFYYL